MKKAALAALLFVLVPLQAGALETNELLGLVAMPLAVAAASEVTGVPAGELSQFVATLNRAQVPATQVVQVVRYAPAALVIEDQQPAFVEYVDTQVDQGIVGTQLVTVIEDRYRTYDLDPQVLTFEEPATTYVVRDDYIPDVVVTRVAQVQPGYLAGDTSNLLALAAMPLAVAAVADITGIPFGDLSSLVSSLNAARMPPLQVVEVLRYSPVVLVDQYERPRFVQFVNAQVVSGVTGTRLINVIDDRFRTYDVTPQFNRVEVREVVNVVEDDDFFPRAVTSRVAKVRAHPHGGPPGQLKKELGVQTGAEVVHGAARRTAQPRDRVVARNDRDDDRKVVQKRRSSENRERRVTRRSDDAPRRVVQERPKKVRVERVSPNAGKREVTRVERPRPERVKVERENRGGGGGNSDKGKGGNGKGGNGKGKGKG